MNLKVNVKSFIVGLLLSRVILNLFYFDRGNRPKLSSSKLTILNIEIILGCSADIVLEMVKLLI